MRMKKETSRRKRALALLLCIAALISLACSDPTSTVIFPNAEASARPTLKPTPVPTAVPTEVPTAVPTEVPTAEPTQPPTPTPKPTSVPKTFLFGGAELPAGLTKIDKNTVDENGNKVIGEKTDPKRITKKEVEALVALCPNLSKLVLDYCYLDDYTPLSKLTGLTDLALMTCGNEYGGEKLDDIGWISTLTELTDLTLCYNNISDITPLAGLENLEYLNLAGNDLDDEDLKVLAKLPSLTTLYLYWLPNLTDVTPLAEIEYLCYLHLGHDSKIESVKPLTKLKYLTQLRINDTAVKDISYFGDFKHLKYLDLSDCARKASDYAVLGNCPKLKGVAVANAPDDVKTVFAGLSGITLANGWNSGWNN